MHLTALARWHWVVIAGVVGLIGGAAVRAWTPEPFGVVVPGLGRQITDRGAFESALTHTLAGRPLFTDVVVHPRWSADAAGRPVRVDVVAGRYCDGRVTGSGAGSTAVWRPACYIASRPYRPATELAADPATAARFAHAGPSPTVCDYLDALAASADVRYSTAWWEGYPYLTCLTVSLALVGGVWPTAVNLIAFGSVTRPPEAKGPSLWRVRNPSNLNSAAPRPVTLAGSEVPATGAVRPGPGPSVAAITPEPPHVQRPAAEPLLPAIERERAAAEYAKREEDYYPTVKRGGP